MYALLSVSDKHGIVDFAHALQTLGYRILSTGGTLKVLQEAKIEVQDVAAYTQSPEMFEGRVKTLHPKIHGGILHRREVALDREAAKEQGIVPIDLVCVNLYPFKETTQRTEDFGEVIENIDIGGPSMIRAAAKNFQDVLVLTDPKDYLPVIEKLRANENTLEFRRAMMVKAFEHTAAYDACIANYMNERFSEGFGAKHFIVGEKVQMTHYGENPHQRGALYTFGSFFSDRFRTLKGAASFNNLGDLNSAVKIASAFGHAPCISIVKHGNPCGFALKTTLLESYRHALLCDPISAYGGVVAINGTLDHSLAQEISQTFIEVIVAARVTPEALALFESKKRTKIFTCDSEFLDFPSDLYDFKHIEGGFLLQDSDKIAPDEIEGAKCMGKAEATLEQKRDMEIAYRVAALVKSNCVVYVKDSAMVAVGMGMTSRVDAAKAALAKAKELGLNLQGAALASEAFFPFRDSIDSAHEAGVGAIIQPGGSIRDEEVIEAADTHGIPLYFTGKRHFLH